MGELEGKVISELNNVPIQNNMVSNNNLWLQNVHHKMNAAVLNA